MNLRRIASNIINEQVSQIDFPKEEYNSLKEKLLQGHSVYTTRILNEIGKYRPSQILDSPFGKLVVENVQNINDVRLHPFFSELTDSQIKQLTGHDMDLVKLKLESYITDETLVRRWK